MENKDYKQLINNIGTPNEYSDSLYLVYIELYKADAELGKVISEHSKIVSELEFGYICEANMQDIPEIARSLSLKNHAIYQIVRLEKLS
ncbi:hypothetical protein [Flavobacterium sp. ACN6]|uniref:hypothetical protein n=1 Tax=Flavobacterium sp. ACN6 TaxID=1920426 RepID=UPI000BB307BA|nr:hypothetical protein [Flavobacterium sp. ACN6]PBJ12203.1 hypothetical protein BSF42_21580 [Flavobacterium sp. ACN6]